MPKSVRKFTVALAMTTLLAMLAACGGNDSTDSDSQAGDGSGQTHNSADVSFTTGMIPHHGQAIEMADMAIKQAESADVIDLARQIKDAQEPEIQQMSGWLESWGEPVPDSTMGSMSGMEMENMMTGQEMKMLGDSSGVTFDRRWLAMMIEHHRGAIAMAETELTEGESAEAKQLATAIIDAQQTEIDTMGDLVKTLGGSKALADRREPASRP